MFFKFDQKNLLLGIFSLQLIKSSERQSAQIIGHRTFNFSHTFTVIFAVFPPKQDGVRHREKVY
jgi:hypothetical protein